MRLSNLGICDEHPPSDAYHEGKHRPVRFNKVDPRKGTETILEYCEAD